MSDFLAAMNSHLCFQRVEEGLRPPVHIVLEHGSAKGAHPSPTFRAIHHESAVNGFGSSVDVVRIHEERLAQLLAGSGEFAEHGGPLPSLACIVRAQSDV